MLDTLHLPRQTRADVQIFNRLSTVSGTQYMTWLKPRGASMVHILCIGGGGGGGGGLTGAAGTGRGGGGSGGSSATSRVTLPLILLPDRLYIQVGAGGQGVGSGGGVAGSGVKSLVSIAPNNQSSNNIAMSGAVGAVGGGSGTAAAGGAAGTAGTIAAIGSMALAGSGQFALIAGQIGVIGGDDTGVNGTAITIPTTSVLCQAGSSGAGTTSANFAGGAFTAIADSWLSEQRPATPASGSNNGSGGPQIWQPFFSFGGGGGSSNNTGVGGAGGNGAHGAGGGGGGGGTTGGRGGNGGSGIVIIIAW